MSNIDRVPLTKEISEIVDIAGVRFSHPVLVCLVIRPVRNAAVNVFMCEMLLMSSN